MSNQRRKFLTGAAGLLGGTAFGMYGDTWKRIEKIERAFPRRKFEDFSSQEEFWRQVRLCYTVSPQLVNLNNGGVSPQPKVVQEAVERFNRMSNETPSYYMWRILDQGREPLRKRLANLAGAETEELAINRNSSEALETIIFGLRLKAGDEVVLSNLDYPNMFNAWKQRAHRDGVVLKWVKWVGPVENPEDMASAYVDLFTDKTKVVHLTHVMNWNGQIAPVAEVAKEAHKRGIEVVVDAAHSFAHFPYQIPDLHCDYWGTSLHKWLGAPFGSGLLYVRKDKISQMYPLLAAPDPEADDIRKFESLGTRSFAIEQAIGQAIDFHRWIGSDRKADRLYYLKNYWVEKVKDLPGIRFFSPVSKGASYALCTVGFVGKSGTDLANFLMKEYKIHSVAIQWEFIEGVRITPNTYTRIEELDKLVEALKEYSK